MAQISSDTPQAPQPTQSDETLVSQPRSPAELQVMVRREIVSLNAAVQERLNEIERLARLLGQGGETASKSDAQIAEEVEAKLAAQKRRHAMQLNLLHKIYAGQPNKAEAMGVAVADQLETVRNSDGFDAKWYLETYTDVAATDMTPAEHYVSVGAFEGRDPGPDFDTLAYYAANPDVADAGWPALLHYVLFGKDENRPIG
ncbi:MAG: hypothetical protein ABJQ23_01030 [Shimia thalassica]|uniref:hypothetical protein n=1 Tax=Shimia thalassica TaxID=1715693 RepID=UPI003297B2A2